MAREVYDKHFRVACATPRGVVAKLCNIVGQIEEACHKHSSHYEKVSPWKIKSMDSYSSLEQSGIYT